jgi:hypothetical protein
MTLLLTAYREGLSDLPEPHVLEACKRWPTLPEKGKWWPALEELRATADDVACEHRVRALPKPPVSPFRQAAPPDAPPVIKDPAAMRQLIASIRANPAKFVAGKELADLGDAMLARWEHSRLKVAS